MPTTSPDATRPLGARKAAALAVFVCVVTVQALVPAVQLGADTQGRFGWQMFAGVEVSPIYTVRFPDDRLDTVRIEDHVVNARGDIDFPALLPEHLCGRSGGATAVVVDWPGDGERRSEHPCR